MIYYYNAIFFGILIGLGEGAVTHAYVIKDKYILHHSPKDQRVKLFSANSMFNSLAIFLILSIFGRTIDITSIITGLIIILFMYIFLGIGVFSFKKKIE